jgi:hypothetical protein
MTGITSPLPSARQGDSCTTFACYIYPSLPEVLQYIINKACYVYAGCNRCFCVLEGKHSVKFCYTEVWDFFLKLCACFEFRVIDCGFVAWIGLMGTANREWHEEGVLQQTPHVLKQWLYFVGSEVVSIMTPYSPVNVYPPAGLRSIITLKTVIWS